MDVGSRPPSAVEPWIAGGRPSSMGPVPHRSAKRRASCWHDHQIAALCLSHRVLDELPNRTDGSDDRRAGRVRHEGLQRLQGAGAIRVLGEWPAR